GGWPCPDGAMTCVDTCVASADRSLVRRVGGWAVDGLLPAGSAPAGVLPLRHDLAGIHQALGVEGVLDGAHQLDGRAAVGRVASTTTARWSLVLARCS